MFGSFFKKNRIVLIDILCFFLGAFGIYLILLYGDILASSDYSIISGDLKENYIPAIRNICRSIKEGNGILYSWMYGMGSNMSLYNAYYAYSPFNFLYYFFYDFNMNLVTVVTIVLKVGMAALCFRIYVRKAFRVSDEASVLLAVFYSLSSFQIVYNVQNIIWLDAIFVLPMVCLGIHKCISEKKVLGLIFWYTYIFVSQFYMGYMIGIFSFIFFFVSLYLGDGSQEKKKTTGTIARYLLAVAAAIGASALVWLSALCYLLQQGGGKLSEFSNPGINILDVLNQFFWGEASGYDAVFPYIYCGILTLVLAVVYFADRNRVKKEKLGYGIILLVLFLSCLVTPLYAMWHGFDFPNSYGYRFSYIISFVVCVIAAREMDEICGVSKKVLTFVVIGLLGLFIVEKFWQSTRFDSSVVSNSIALGVVNAFLIILWISLLLIKNGISEKYKRVVVLVMLFVAITEAVTNGSVMLEKRDASGRKLLNTAYNTWYQIGDGISKELKKDNSFFRVCSYQDLGASTGMYCGYNTVSFFGSSENIRLRNVLGYMGIWNSPRTVRSFGITEPVKMILGIKYDTFGDKVYVDTNGQMLLDSVIEENETDLGVGFLVEGTPDDYDCMTTNAFENINTLLSVMTGTDVRVFFPVDESIISVEEHGLHISNTSEGKRIECNQSEPMMIEQPECILRINSSYNDQLYAYVDNFSSYYSEDSYVLYGGDENYIDQNGVMTVSYIKHLEEEDGNPVLKIVSNGNRDRYEFRDIYFYFLSLYETQMAYTKLEKGRLEVSEYESGYIKGTVSSEGEKLLFTSIPYEKGWKAYVDGVEQDITPVLYESLIAIPIKEGGNHEVELVFNAPGFAAGTFVSLVSVFAIVVMGIYVFHKRKTVVGIDE